MPDDGAVGPGRNAVDDELQQAHRAISDAEGAHAADLSDEVVINRCYYACFHAAQATLYDEGANPGSHTGVLSLFGSEVVETGGVPREHGRLLNRLSELRKQADYGYGTIDEDVPALISKTRQFVSDVEALCARD